MIQNLSSFHRSILRHLFIRQGETQEIEIVPDQVSVSSSTRWLRVMPAAYSFSVRAGASSFQTSFARRNTAQPLGQPTYMVAWVMMAAISSFVTP